MENQKQAVSAQETSVMVSSSKDQITTVDMFDQNRAKSALMVASTIAASSLIPAHYHRRPENVLVAMYRSARLGMDLFAYMEITFPVNGKMGHEAKFIVSRINTSGKFKGPVRYEFSGEIIRKDGIVQPTSTRKCTAWTKLKDDGERIEQSVDLGMAFREGWMKKTGSDKTVKTSKWHTITDEMLQYRAAKFLGNMYCPEAVMGLDMREELEDITDAEVIDEAAGKDIFEKKDAEVNTEPEPVVDPAKQTAALDPSKEIKAAVVTTPAEPVTHTAVPPEQGQQSDVGASSPAATAATIPDEPPQDPKAFLEWLMIRFASESTEIDVFLMQKKWLPMGGTLADLNNSQLKNLRSQWSKFVPAYDAFKKARKS